MNYYDQFDQANNRVYSKIILVPGMSLPEGHYWKEHEPTLEETKLAKLEEIAFNRNLAKYANIEVLGHTWQADTISQSLISQAISLDQAGVVAAPTIWRDFDNNNVEVTIDQLKSIAAAMAQSTQQAYIKSWILKAQVDTAEDVATVNSITWS